VGEQDGPAVTDELMEVNLALGGQCLEVGSYNTLQLVRHLLVHARLHRGWHLIQTYQSSPGAGAAVPGAPQRRTGGKQAGLGAAGQTAWPKEQPLERP
jgi:hypothetical protein